MKAGLPSLVAHLNQLQLARRWSISPRTLERWRWVGEGPPFLKLGGRVLYRLEDVESYEALRLRSSATGRPIDRADRSPTNR
jgi:helix-turn-helix protein